MEKKIFIISLFLCLFVFGSAQEIPGKSEGAVRVMCYNVKNCTGMDDVTDYQRIADIVKRISPDVVALQELDSVTERSKRVYVLEELGKRTGMHYTFGSAIDFMGGKYGVGILSKEKPLSHKTVPLPGREERRVLLIVEFPDYYLCCTHFTLTREDKMETARIVIESLQDISKPLFLAGDLNSAYDSDAQLALREKFTVLNDPAQGTVPVVNPRRCIDFIYGLKNGHTYQVLHRMVLNEPVASDHLPLFVDVRLSGCNTYTEADEPSTERIDWSAVKGLQYSFGSINRRYAKSQIPQLTPSVEWTGCGWRGERLSSQLVLWSDKNVEQVEFEFSPFQSANGSTLNPSVAQARFVRYVLTDEFASGCGYRKPEDFAVSLSADALDNVECFDLKARTTLPVWLTFDIPETASPGLYSGTLYLSAKGEKKRMLKINLDVLPQSLPQPKEWKFHLDMWQHPAAVARVHGVECWSEEHWKLLDAPMRMLADAGQKVITATINKDPWNHQCFDAYEDMIFWTRKADGTWVYDYTVFDRWVGFMMDLGIDKQINCYSMIPWNNEIHYRDEKKDMLVTSGAKPGTKEFEAIWTPFLHSFKAHLKEKGWLDITNIAMDERPPKEMNATIELIEKAAPELGVAIQDNHKSYKQFPNIKDICISLRGAFEDDALQFRKANGLISTYYVCCSHRFPNIFTFSDPAEAVYMAWHAKATGFDGFLHWSYNSWVENPLMDSRFRTWPAGDTYVIYPDGRSSIRFERLREGIQDAEKIRILQEQFTAEGNTEKIKRLNEVVAAFNSRRPPEIPLGQFVDQAKAVLVELSR